MKKPIIVIGVLATVFLLAPVVVPLFCPWSEINCRHQDINIKNGQTRISRYLWFVKVSESMAGTPLSVALRGETVDVADIEAWQRVNTFCLGTGHSPHYHFHSALHQAEQIDMIESMLEVTPERKQEIAKEILTAWQESGDYHSADEYIHTLLENSSTKASPVAPDD